MQTSRRFLSFRETMGGIYNNGGFMRFWTGSTIIASASIPAHALYFSIYEFMKIKLGVNNTGFQFVASGLTGAIATFFHDLIITPADSNFY